MSIVYTPEQLLGFSLKRAQHAYRTRIDDDLRSLGLTAPQYAVMAAVDAVVGISNADLARAAFVTPQTMQGILANLERDTLLTRSPHPQHKRILCNTLTERGRKLLRQARQRVNAIEELLAGAVGNENIILFTKMLSQCADRLADD